MCQMEKKMDEASALLKQLREERSQDQATMKQNTADIIYLTGALTEQGNALIDLENKNLKLKFEN